ncbi:hypothetical protein B0H11DRAFT_1941109 [Mycena galericulata]|nr:hypothetical protein B0H11DRAFT_1941109 [Mycena galericulata]
MSATSRAGVLLPLPTSFDLVAYSTRPNDIPAPSGMELDDKNAENCVIETHNKASILLTRAYARAKETSAGVGALDVGLPLKAMWAYTDEEKASLLHCPEYVAATGPLPRSLVKFIATCRAAAAVEKEKDRLEKEAEKARSNKPLLGSLVFTKPHTVTPILKQQVTIPGIYLVSVRLRVHIPLHWWTDKNIRLASSSPHTIAKEYARSEQTATFELSQRVQVMDVAKNAKIFGGEDERAGLSPVLWLQASGNQLSAYKDVCAAVDPNDPTTRNFASEYAAHILFFSRLDCFDDRMDVWFPVEQKLRKEIWQEGYYDEDTWMHEMRSVLAAHDAARSHALGYGSVTPAGGAAPHKRPVGDEGDASVAKRPRLDQGQVDDGAWRRRQPAPPRGPVECLICLAPNWTVFLS